jgi:nucleotide-binding universal stress UspA family protein
MLDRVLFPIDGSNAALAVLPCLREIATRSAAQVTVLRVVDTVVTALLEYPGAVAVLETERALVQAASEAEEVAARLGPTARTRVNVGSAAETILEAAVEERAELIAMSTHGRTGIARWAFGSVAEKVLRASSVPVLLARSHVELVEPRPFRHILVPTAGTDLTLGVLPLASRLARLFSARVTVAHFVSDYAGRGATAVGQRYLDAACETLADLGVTARGELHRGDAATGILDYGVVESAEPVPVDLVAMATHARTGVRRWVLGSVTEKVLRHAAVPLLVVPSGTRAARRVSPPVGHASP